MYSLDILKKYEVKYSWLTIYTGVKLKLIDSKTVSEFAVELMDVESKEISDNILDFAWMKDEYNKFEILSKIRKEISQDLIDEESEPWKTEVRKWRYCILQHVYESCLNNEDLLYKVAKVYSDFDYPDDMANLIHYMPPTDDYNPKTQSHEENIKRLVLLIKDFLNTEKMVIQRI